MSDDVETQEETTVEEAKPIAGIGTLVFGKYDAAEVVCRDPGLAPYISLNCRSPTHRWSTRKRMVRKSTPVRCGEIHEQANAHWKVHWQEDGRFESIRKCTRFYGCKERRKPSASIC